MKMLMTLTSFPSLPDPGLEVEITEKDIEEGFTMVYGEFIMRLKKIRPKYGSDKKNKAKKGNK